MAFRSPQSIQQSDKMILRGQTLVRSDEMKHQSQLSQTTPGCSKFFKPCENINATALDTSESEREEPLSQNNTKNKARRRKYQKHTKKDFKKDDIENENEQMEIVQTQNKRKMQSSDDEENKTKKRTIDCSSPNHEVQNNEKTKKQTEIVEIVDLDETSDPVEENVTYMKLTSNSNLITSEVQRSKIENQIEETEERVDETKINAQQTNEFKKKEERRQIHHVEIIDGSSTYSAPQLTRETQNISTFDVNKQSSKVVQNCFNIYAKGIHTNLTRVHPIRIQNELNKTLGRQVKISKSGESLRITCENEAEKNR